MDMTMDMFWQWQKSSSPYIRFVDFNTIVQKSICPSSQAWLPVIRAEKPYEKDSHELLKILLWAISCTDNLFACNSKKFPPAPCFKPPSQPLERDQTDSKKGTYSFMRAGMID
jgi:hypothetical protein